MTSAGDCMSVGGHYDPAGVVAVHGEKYAELCAASAEECELGDLSGRLGKLLPVPGDAKPYKALSHDRTLAVFDAVHLFESRSVVVHDPEGARIACGNIKLKAHQPHH
mmetsp:Transcript_14001/g.45984  ORF Transcript_14001/g.45984 Transcript_14001/m.45984 type:complete len:108 (+) Transcript_14001:1-324(+)